MSGIAVEGSRAVKHIRREDMLEAALRLFRERGYEGATLRDIATACGFSQASLYYHFKAKRDLLDALAAPLFAEVDALLASTSGTSAPPERSRLLAAQLDLMLAHAPVAAWLLNDPGVRRDDTTWQRVLDHERQLMSLMGGGADADTSEQLRVAAALATVAGIVARLYAHLEQGGGEYRDRVRRAALTAALSVLTVDL